MVIDLFLLFTKFVFGCAFSEYVVEQDHVNYNSNGDSASPWNIPL